LSRSRGRGSCGTSVRTRQRATCRATAHRIGSPHQGPWRRLARPRLLANNKQFTERKFMNTSINEPPTTELHQQRPAIQKASEPADAVVADEVSFVKKHRRLLVATGLAAGGLAVALMAGGSKPATKDPRLLS